MMITKNESIIKELYPERKDEHASMDVLLQLTLPIILILAILVMAWIEELKETKVQLSGSSADNLNKELDYIILELQHQFLLKSTDTVINETKVDIKLASYSHFIPNADDIFNNRYDSLFANISHELWERFGDDNKLQNTNKILQMKILKKYKEYVQEFLNENTMTTRKRRKLLRKITDENKKFYETKLLGHLSKIRKVGVDTQLKVIKSWLEDDRSFALIKGTGSEKWEYLQKEESSAQIKMASEQFYLLLVTELRQKLERDGIKLLDGTIEKIKL